MELEKYEINGGKVLLAKSEIEALITNYEKEVELSHEDRIFYNVMFYNGKISLLKELLKLFDKNK